MVDMTFRIRGSCIGCGGVLALTTFVGCAQSARERAQTINRTAQATAVAAATTATGANTSVARPVAPRNVPRIKPNGRGGYDSSELQAAAIKRAHYLADRYGTLDGRPRAMTPPSTQPVLRPVAPGYRNR
jgi:hypothetical protein